MTNPTLPVEKVLPNTPTDSATNTSSPSTTPSNTEVNDPNKKSIPTVDVSSFIKSNDNEKVEKPIDVSSFLSTPTANTESDNAGFYDQSIMKYNKFISNYNPDSKNLDAEAAYGQSAWGKVGNMLMKGVVGDVLNQGVIGGVGALIGVPQLLYHAIKGDDEEFSNFLTDLADKNSKALDEQYPIMLKHPGKSFDVGDFGWWCDTVEKGVFPMIGMLLPAEGEAMASGWISKGLKGLSELEDITSASNAAKFGSNVISKIADLGDTNKYWQGLAHRSLIMRNSMNFQDAMATHNSITEEALNDFKDNNKYQEVLNSKVGQDFVKSGRVVNPANLAEYLGAKASWVNYGYNAANIIFDAVQFAPALRGFKTATREGMFSITPTSVLKAQAKAVGETLSTGRILANNALMGGERVIEGMTGGAALMGYGLAREESNLYGKQLLGDASEKENDSTFMDRLGNYLQDPNSYESAFVGGLGGLVFGQITRNINSVRALIKNEADPNSYDARVKEIESRVPIIGEYTGLIKNILEGIDPGTKKTFVGTDDEIAENKQQYIDKYQSELADNLGLNASRHGNVGSLIAQLDHPNFQKELVEMGFANEKTISEKVSSLKQSILDAETSYQSIYNKVFSSCAEKGNEGILDIILGQGVLTNGTIKRLDKSRLKYEDEANKILQDNPSYETFKTQFPDHDVDGTLQNAANIRAIQYINSYIDNEKDPIVQDFMKRRLEQRKEEFRQANKDLGDKKLPSNYEDYVDLTSLDNYIDKKASALLLTFAGDTQKAKFEKQTNPTTGVKTAKNMIDRSVKIAKDKSFNTFKSNTDAQFTPTKNETFDTIKDKIDKLNALKDQVSKNKQNPYDTKITGKLETEDINKYHNQIDAKTTALEREKTRLTNNDNFNKILTNGLQSLFNESGIDIKVEYTRTLENPVVKKIVDNINNKTRLTSPLGNNGIIQELENHIRNGNNESITLPSGEHIPLRDALKEFIKNDLNNNYKVAKNANLHQEFVNALLSKMGYIPRKVDSKSNTHIDNLNNFEQNIKSEPAVSGESITNSNIKQDASKENSGNKETESSKESTEKSGKKSGKKSSEKVGLIDPNQTELPFNEGSSPFGSGWKEISGSEADATPNQDLIKVDKNTGKIYIKDNSQSTLDFNKAGQDTKVRNALRVVTDLVNHTENGKPIYTDEKVYGGAKKSVFIHFNDLLAQFAKTATRDQLERYYNTLQEAYIVASTVNKSTNGITELKWDSANKVHKLDIKTVLDRYSTADPFATDHFKNSGVIEETGGKGALNTYPFIKEGLNNNRTQEGHISVSPELGKQLDLILNQLGQDSTIRIRLNTDYASKNNLSLNEDNFDNYPIVIEANSGDRTIPIASLNTLFTDHKGVRYKFDGKDWTDLLLSDNHNGDHSISASERLGAISNLYPDLQAWFNSVRNGATNTKEANDILDHIYENDPIDVISDLIGHDKILTNKQGKEALKHILNVMFFGENINKSADLQFNTVRTLTNIQAWKDKLYRDHVNNKKIRNIIGNDPTKQLESTIVHRTSGSVVTTQDLDGNMTYGKVGDRFLTEPKLYKVKYKNDKRVLSSINNDAPEMGTPKGAKFTFYAGLVDPSNHENIIPIALMPNSLMGDIHPVKDGQHIVDTVHGLLMQLGELRRQAETTNIEGTNSDLNDVHNKINEVEHNLQNYVNVTSANKDSDNIPTNGGFLNTNHIFEFTSKVDDKDVTIRFNPFADPKDSKESPYTYYRRDGNDLISKRLSEDEFKNHLGGIKRNVNYDNFGKPFEGYDTYEDYLLKSGSYVTNVGHIIDTDGKKISNFTMSGDNNYGGANYIMNIDTDKFSQNNTGIDTLSKLRVTHNLDQSYDFAMNMAQSMIDDNNLTFGGMNKEMDNPNAFAQYNPRTKAIELSNKWEEKYKEDPAEATRLLVHEITHGKINTMPKEERESLRNDLRDFHKDIIATDEYKQLLSIPEDKRTEQQNTIIKIMDASSKDQDELLTYGLTNLDLAHFLDGIKGSETIETPSFVNRLKNIIRRFFNSTGVKGSKLDDLTSIFDKHFDSHIVGERQIEDLNENEVNLPEVDRDADYYDVSDLPDLQSAIFSSSDTHNFTDEQKDFLDAFRQVTPNNFTRREYTLQSAESKQLVLKDLFPDAKVTISKGVDTYLVRLNTNTNTEESKPATITSSKIREIFTGTTMDDIHKSNLLDVASDFFLRYMEGLGQDINKIKIKDIGNETRNNLGRLILNDALIKHPEDFTDEQKTFLKQGVNELKTNDVLWNDFKTQLHINHAVRIVDRNDLIDSNEILKKGWDDEAAYRINPIDTITNEVRQLINRTRVVDPNNTTIDKNGNVVIKTDTNTPTGYPNLLKYNEIGAKLIELSSNAINKQEVLNELYKYATTVNNPKAKSLLSIWDKLRKDDSLLQTWVANMDKQIMQQYRTLFTSKEGNKTVDIDLSNKNIGAFAVANEWLNTIVTRTQSNYYTPAFTKDYEESFKKIIDASSIKGVMFKIMDDKIASDLSNIYHKLGLDIGADNIKYEFTKDQSNFVANMVAPVLYLKSLGDKAETKAYIDNYNKNENYKFGEYGNLLNLAAHTVYFRDNVSNYSNTNINNNLVYDAQQHHFLSVLMKKLHSNPESAYNTLIEYTKVPSSQHSLFLWGDQQTENGDTVIEGRGFINYTIKNGIKVPISLESGGLHIDNLNNFKYLPLDGMKDIMKGTSKEYSDLNERDWNLLTMINYLGGSKIADNAILPLINPSDRGRSGFLQVPKISIDNNFIKLLSNRNRTPEENTTFYNHPIFKQIKNTIYGEATDMLTAMDVLFKKNDNGQYNNNDLNDVTPQLYYHYKLDDNGNKTYIATKKNVDGNTIIDEDKSGNAFRFHNILLNINGKERNLNNITIGGKVLTQILFETEDLKQALNYKGATISHPEGETVDSFLNTFVDGFIVNQHNNGKDIFEKYQDELSQINNKKRNNSGDFAFNPITTPEDFERHTTEFMLNNYLHNTEQIRMMYGSIADYKTFVDFNKRAGQILATGINNSITPDTEATDPNLQSGTFTGSTISDVFIRSKVYDERLKSLWSKFQPELKNGEPKELTDNKKRLFNKIYDSRAKMEAAIKDPIERQIYDLASPYLSNDAANATTFITLPEFERRVRGFGKYSQYKDIINTLNGNEELSRDQYIRLATMQKNFYYSNEYNEELRKMVPNQIKNAEVILNPQLIKGLQLEELVKTMDEAGVHQVTLASAEKLGTLNIATIHNSKGELLDHNTVVAQLKNASRAYNYANLRMQQEVSDKVIDEDNKLGVQISKKILNNIPNDSDYTVNGEKIKGKTLKNHTFNLMVHNIESSARDLCNNYGVDYDSLDKYVNIDKIITKLSDSQPNDTASNNSKFALKINPETGKPNIPLSFSLMSEAYEAVLTGDVTKNVTNQHFPGLHTYQMSDLFMTPGSGKRASDLLQSKSNTDGVNWSQDIIDRGDYKLRSTHENTKDGTTVHAEVLLPRWSSMFFKDGQKLDINDLPEDVRTMVGYRIPTEDKYSMYVFKVAGFLPESTGATMVLPDDFITQTNADFDIDSVFNMSHNLYTDKNGKIACIPYDQKMDDKSITSRRNKYVKNTSAGREIANEYDPKITDLYNRIQEAWSSDTKNITDDKIKNLAAKEDVKPFLDVRQDLKEEADILSQTIDQIDTNPDIAVKVYKTINKLSGNTDIDVTPDNVRDLYNKELDTLKQKQTYIEDQYNKFNESQKNQANELSASYDIRKNRNELLLKQKNDLINERNVKYDNLLSNKDFSKLPIEQQNTVEARQNRLLDIYSGILDNPNHIAEITQGSTFKDITASKTKLEEILSSKDPNYKTKNIPVTTYDGQIQYRKRVMEGRNLKGISVGADGLISISEVANMGITNSYCPVTKIKITDINQEKYLKKSFNAKIVGKDNTKLEDKDKTSDRFALIYHNKLGNNPEGTFTNVEGNKITAYSAQTTANILDNVKDPIPPNINPNTFGIWKMFASTGSTYNIATAFINQDAIRDIITENMNENNNAINDIRSQYQTWLYQLQAARTGVRNAKYDSAINQGFNIRVYDDKKSGERGYSKLGYEKGTIIPIEEKELYDNIAFAKKSEIQEAVKNPTSNPERVKQIEDYLRYQCQMIESFETLKRTSNQLASAATIFNTDKIGVGPSFENTITLLDMITEFSNEEKEFKPPLILHINGKNPAVAIYPQFFKGHEKENSVYPTLQKYLFDSNILGLSLFREHFINYSPAYIRLKENFHYKLNLPYNESTAKQFSTYLNTRLLYDHPYLSTIGKEERERIIGINQKVNTTLNLNDQTNLPIFQSLSTANKVQLLKEHLRTTDEDIDNNILTYLQAKTRQEDLEHNGYHKIDLINNDRGDKLVNSFNNLWYSDNPFQRDTARDIVKYEYLINGINYGYNSIAKLIPNNIFAFDSNDEELNNESGIGLSSHIYAKQQVANSDAKYDVEKLFGNTENDIHENFLRSNWENNKFVPDAATIKVNREVNGKNQNIRLFQVDDKTNTIRVDARYLDTIHNSEYQNILDRDIVKIKHEVGDKQHWQLYKRFIGLVDETAIKDKDGNDLFVHKGNLLYFPISKLEGSESGAYSMIDANNLDRYGKKIDTYEGYISKVLTDDNSTDNNNDIHPIKMDMNYDTKHAKFRDELKSYKNTMELIRDGKRTATTRYWNNNQEAQKWVDAKEGTYIELNSKFSDHPEFIKVTKALHNIDLNELSARKEWSEKEGWDITLAHELEKRNDLWQLEFKYIGDKDAVDKDRLNSIKDEELEESQNAEFSSSKDKEIDDLIKFCH
jgi:hypothetical protein